MLEEAMLWGAATQEYLLRIEFTMQGAQMRVFLLHLKIL